MWHVTVQDGTLVEELDRLRVQGRMLPTQEVLHLFSQVGQVHVNT